MVIKELIVLEENLKVYKNKIRLENPYAVQRLLARTINLLNNGMINDGKARTIGYLSNILLHSFETVNIENRLSELEAKILGDNKPN